MALHETRPADRLRTVVLAGGDSHQRASSLESGRSICAALRHVGHEVCLVDPTEDLSAIDWTLHDVCFVAAHGADGEDGRLQHELARLGVRYTGSGPMAARLAMSKSAAKERFFQAHVPTAPYALFHSSESPREILARVRELHFPLVIKPDSQFASLGVSCAQSADELEQAAATAFRYDDFAIAEPLIAGREFSVAVLGRRPLPIVEVRTGGEIYSHTAKREQRFDFDLAPKLDSTTAARLQDVAVAAAASLRTAGLVRVDVLLTADDRPVVLEVNTVPSLSEGSLAIVAASSSGYDLPKLCDHLLRDCLGAGAKL